MTKPGIRSAGLVLAVFLLSLVFFGGLGASSQTDATWSAERQSRDTFEAGTLGQIEHLQCEDGAAILDGRVRLNWDEPPAASQQDIVYDVAWTGGGLLAGGGSTTTTDTSYLYTPSLLSSVAQFNITYTVTPRLVDASWVGDPAETSASGIGLLGIIISFGCD